jgi:tetratricopeptide (TPR) repeat protein
MALDLEKDGKYEEAIKYLDKAIDKKPNLRPAVLNRGADKSMIGDYKGAIEDYEKLLRFDSDNTIALMNIGNNYKRLDQYEKAVKYYSKSIQTKGAIESDSSYFHIRKDWEMDEDYHIRKFEIQYERGITYMHLKKYNLAIIDLKQAVKYGHELPDAASWLGEAYYRLNDTIQAKKYLTYASNQGLIDAEELLKKLE